MKNGATVLFAVLIVLAVCLGVLLAGLRTDAGSVEVTTGMTDSMASILQQTDQQPEWEFVAIRCHSPNPHPAAPEPSADCRNTLALHIREGFDLISLQPEAGSASGDVVFNYYLKRRISNT